MDDLERTLRKDEAELESLQYQVKKLSDKIRAARSVVLGDKVQRLNAMRKELLALQSSGGKTRRDEVRRESLQGRIADLQSEVKQLKAAISQK